MTQTPPRCGPNLYCMQLLSHGFAPRIQIINFCSFGEKRCGENSVGLERMTKTEQSHSRTQPSWRGSLITVWEQTRIDGDSVATVILSNELGLNLVKEDSVNVAAR